MTATAAAHVYRTVGGLYLVTDGEWGKVTALRPTRSPAGGPLQPLDHLAQVLGFDARNAERMTSRVIEPGEVMPGFARLTLQGRRMHDWASTTPIVDTHAGTFVDEIDGDHEHLLFGLKEAWLVSVGHARRLLAEGWDGAEVQPDLDGRLSGLRILRLDSSRRVELTVDDAIDLTPGWGSEYRHLESNAETAGARVRGILRTPTVDALTWPLLDDAPHDDAGAVPPELVEAIASTFRRACRSKCGGCGSLDVVLASIPEPYLIGRHLLCATCAALKRQGILTAMTPSGGLTPLMALGERVTMWRSADALYLSTANGFAVAASLDLQEPLLPLFPVPRQLKLSLAFTERVALDAALSRDDWANLKSSGVGSLLPGVTASVLPLSDRERIEFTVLDTYAGHAVETVSDVGTYIVWQAGATRSQTGAWLVVDGVATAVLEDGWDGLAAPEFDLEKLEHLAHTEIGIIKVDTLHTGVSNSRAGIDLLAPGWAQLLDALAGALDEMDPAPVLTHAGVHPLTGAPILRLNLSASEDGDAARLRHIRGVVRGLREGFFRSCMACGGAGQEMTLLRGKGVVTRILCIDDWLESSDD